MGPVGLEGRGVFRFEKHRDLRGPARHAPVHIELLSGLLLPVIDKRTTEGIANLVVVRCDDDNAPVEARRRGAFLRLENPRSRKREQHREGNQDLLPPTLHPRQRENSPPPAGGMTVDPGWRLRAHGMNHHPSGFAHRAQEPRSILLPDDPGTVNTDAASTLEGTV